MSMFSVSDGFIARKGNKLVVQAAPTKENRFSYDISELLILESGDCVTMNVDGTVEFTTPDRSNARQQWFYDTVYNQVLSLHNGACLIAVDGVITTIRTPKRENTLNTSFTWDQFPSKKYKIEPKHTRVSSPQAQETSRKKSTLKPLLKNKALIIVVPCVLSILICLASSWALFRLYNAHPLKINI